MSHWIKTWLAAVVAVALVAPARAGDGPTVRLPALEQGSEVKGDTLLDVVWRPADDGTPVLKLDVSIDDEVLIAFDLQPTMRNVTYNWATAALFNNRAQWSDGRHDIVARIQDAKGRVSTYRTFVYVRNHGRPATANATSGIEIQDTDGQIDNVITQRALIQVKVDPKLGAKWVILYLNDKMIAMMNYPPYQEVLDPVKRQMADGPYVVKARVIHPDGSESYPDPANFEVNLSGSYTPLRPAIGAPPAAPAAPAVPLVPAPAAPALPTDMPGLAQTSEAALPGGLPPAMAAERTATGRPMQPEVTDGGRVDLAGGLPIGHGTARLGGAAVPASPATPATEVSRPVAPARTVMGPPIPARTGTGATRAATVRDAAGNVAGGSGQAVGSRLATPPVTARLAAPKASAGAAAGGAPGTMSPAAVASATSTGPALILPGRRTPAPRSGAGGSRVAGGGQSSVALAGANGADTAARLGTPLANRRFGGARTDVRVSESLPVAAVATPATAAPASADALVQVTAPSGARPIAEAGPSTVGGDLREAVVLSPSRGGTATATRPAAPATIQRSGAPAAGAGTLQQAGEPRVATASTGRAPGAAQPRATTPAPSRPRTTISSGTPTAPQASKPVASSAAPASRAPVVATPARPAAPRVATPAPRVTPPAAPRVVAPAAPRPAPPVRATVTAPRSIGRVHVVQKGDTLFALATRYHVSVSSLAHVNRLRDRSMLRIGQRLIVPGGLLVVNNKPVKTDVAPLQVRQGVDASPLRFVVEALGGSVSWMGPAEPKRVTATTKDRGVLTITIGSPKAMVNDEAVLMDLAAYLEQGRTMLPTRFISEALDVTIEMDEKSGNILVRSNR